MSQAAIHSGRFLTALRLTPHKELCSMTRMFNAKFIALAALTVALAGCNSFSTARTTPVAGAMLGDKPVDEGLAKRGATVYLAKGCYTCHGMGVSHRRAAPDLLGIM